MESKLNNEYKEPSVMSKDPEERILARRMRIQKRLEKIKKQDNKEDKELDAKTETEKQIDASAELMQKLVDEGDEVISNVRIANEARELHRQEQDFAIRKILLEKLESELADSLDKYDEINSKWSELLDSKDPLDIYDGIQSQNNKCQQVLAQKDVIIVELKNALENADIKFSDDLKNQDEDIDILIDRIDTQINIICKAYRRELVLIEDALKNERSKILEDVTKKWDALYKERQDNEIRGVERRREIMREYENEMNRVLIEHQEQYRAQKIWLETECQKLQQDVENMKALCMINLEKLNYSYTVLKKRQDENAIIKNQQKRRINKLQDIITELKKNYAELENSTRLKIEKLQDQIIKTQKSIEELQSKSNHFTHVNDRQFMQIWEMNTRNADKLLDQIFKVDKIVYEQMLGLEWEPPEESLLKKEDLPSYQEAMRIINKSNNEQDSMIKLCQLKKKDTSPERVNLERKLLNYIMKMISDQTGFLIEDKVHELLKIHTQKAQIVIKLDHVFQALNITSEEQIHLLINFFLPYSYCSICSEDKTTESSDELNKNLLIEESVDKINLDDTTSIMDEKTLRLKEQILKLISSDVKNDDNQDAGRDELEDMESKHLSDVTSVGKKSESEEMKLTCDKGHLLEIKSKNVIKALREFVEKYSRVTTRGLSDSKQEKVIPDNKIVLSRSISEKDIIEYWRRYRDIFSTDKEKLWDALMIGLQKYHDILKDRHKLMGEIEGIQRQNSELRRLLESCKVKPDTGLMQRKTKSANRFN
ncbi:dynein regulatory complex protein 1 isoform X2 [Microplitis mediator]|nr:dynein regulatory complex protein 1 isoform X2 [Microplitis mediator]XP_057325451.1 dynein regulatory complex protein 1 isoform X2 [Microplitis mediator]XP_057325452.1 dynein regulatory complex protein 1 isoform X2 [Microplitis mediator]XP_057325453.1 dynein regulatory complex protein 1 isoform X2 [Microplitis mediator]XP_057325454.1 dynein regulatory complex protein 1 isoform X2 [Microplitis mediator]XP_057325455.1 dynein regulatory complex protein 1 isoform X2 [Microplitis mediator]XP_05